MKLPRVRLRVESFEQERNRGLKGMSRRERGRGAHNFESWTHQVRFLPHCQSSLSVLPRHLQRTQKD